MPGLSAFGILLFPQADSWWFVTNTGKVRLENPKKFAKLCRKEARVFLLTASPDVPQELFPEEEETPKTRQNSENTDEIPPELSDYRDVLDVRNSAILPSFKNTDHEIVLNPTQHHQWDQFTLFHNTN